MLNSNQALLIRAIPSVLFHGHLQNYIGISLEGTLSSLVLNISREGDAPTSLGLCSSISPSSQ